MGRRRTTMARSWRNNNNRGRHGALLFPYRSISSKSSSVFELNPQRSSLQPHPSSTTSIPALAQPNYYPFNSTTSSFSSALALCPLLQNPITFVLATKLTFDDELKMAPILRARKIIHKHESLQQRQHRLLVYALI